jgi:hypothetical protein
MGFEPKIPAFERAKTVDALERAAAVMPINSIQNAKLQYGCKKCFV